MKSFLAACALLLGLVPANAEITTTIEGCTIDKFTVHSASMGREIAVVAVLPPGYNDHPKKSYPILYAFHGKNANCDVFSQMIPLRTALRDKPMIVVSFDADASSFYLDTPIPQWAGRDFVDTTTRVKSYFTTFFFAEFIPAIDHRYRVIAKQRMLTGYSMGGFGAFHYMLMKPAEFVAVSALSGWFPTPGEIQGHKIDYLNNLLGTQDQFPARYHQLDLYYRFASEINAGAKFPPIYITCGTEDGAMIGNNRAMHAFLQQQGVSCQYREAPGIHDYNFWSDASAAIIDFNWRVLHPR